MSTAHKASMRKWTIGVLALFLSCPAAGSASSVLQQQDNNIMKHESDCWVEIYMNEEFDKNGPRLLLVGAYELDSLKGLNDRNWDNDIESVIVGPTATLSMHEDRAFKGRELIIGPYQRVPHLRESGLSNDIESLRITCK